MLEIATQKTRASRLNNPNNAHIVRQLAKKAINELKGQNIVIEILSDVEYNFSSVVSSVDSRVNNLFYFYVNENFYNHELRFVNVEEILLEEIENFVKEEFEF